MRTNDTISGAVLVALGALMIYLTIGFPDFPGQKYGPSLFPRILACGLMLCGVMLIIRGLPAHRAGAPWVTFADWTTDPRRLASFLMLPCLVLLYILLSESVGFLIVAFVLLMILFLWFRTRPLVALPVAAFATWAIHWFFASMMRVPLPRGLLTNIL